MKFRRQRSGGASTGAAGDTLDTDSAFSDDASSMLSSSESSTSSVNGGRVHQVLPLHPSSFCRIEKWCILHREYLRYGVAGGLISDD